jgi:hypothetical protein
MWRQPARLFFWINQRWPQPRPVHRRLSARGRSAFVVLQPLAQHPVKRSHSV